MNDTELTGDIEKEEAKEPEDAAAPEDAKAADDIVTPVPERPRPKPETARLIYSAYAEMRPAPSSKYAPMGMLGYIAMLAVTAIPVVGFIIAAVVAFASKKLARKRLCAAVVILRAVLFALLAAAAAVLIFVYDIDILGRVSSLL